ncbi:3'(2'),5'-bisphosphate nucleotidase [Isoptericola sp. CG 20/1183]|uniref:3'(2'),5'-bisphosphate nucleotidase n=1 Tax=Isoptericola halotolerans TaxID=300560 RepID=A0ABX5EBQ4_9MICO|nr:MULTISPECIES: inositol monophosphatase family protein [Isoptericola]PRZ04944.1 3'(2'),5'-bisphosphate nucleotidase [Isoptericola halotolerans]PRZ05435.1 3'(2'),5'-bisphosphate nucleotidase [Isoptericola sp. CG 20/1183]
MSTTTPVFPEPVLDDAALAAALAEGAGAVLLSLRDEVDAAGGAFEPRKLKDAGDAAAQAWLAAALAHARPDDAVLSEEAKDDAVRTGADRVWIIDPLDGTREFAERSADASGAAAWRDDFAVHVALWVRGADDGTAGPGGLAAGAVALPARGVVHTTGAPSSDHDLDARDASARAVLAGERPLRIAASRSRPPAFVAELAGRDDVELVPMGSAGVKVVSVVDGTVDAYVHGGGQYEWDSAAPVAVALAAGYDCTRLDGTPLEYNRQDPWLPDLFVCHPSLAAHLRAALQGVGVAIKEGAQS